jgi:hypothetical protein
MSRTDKLFDRLAKKNSMTSTQAKELLLLHSFSHPDAAEHPKAAHGFLGSLRPYRGHLIDDNFHDVMQALRTLAPTLRATAIDREVVAALWGICHLARAWGTHPEGMLRRNGLIGDPDIEKLAHWVDMISYATFCLLDGTGEEEAFCEYDSLARSPDERT